ncbi:hypothetical protein [Nonomuraea basaltis]|uniref:hypothetical protein n=1 Tax=Nonomuraea basaltis TaxID=2495887 RepID=UPI00110C6A1E|nr:hypothetical protein [Nonomuraea basaltis]TMR91181.1 hypothetical protein EJK15_51250 [Nonomuraea basaltis]
MNTHRNLVVAGAVAAVALAMAGAVVAGSGTGPPSVPVLRWSPGACVTGDHALTACNGGDSEVMALASDPPGPGQCPLDTDDVLRIGQGRTACVRNFLEPHPGAPGGGGGLLRPGDCVALDGREQPCAGPGWYGRAVAIGPDAASCPAGTLDTLKSAGRVICLGPGGRVLAQGTCVARPGTAVIARSAVERVPCDARHAWARVLSFEKSAGRCPPRSQRYLRGSAVYRPVTCLHLLSQ